MLLVTIDIKKMRFDRYCGDGFAAASILEMR
jgi:hypothetical protein